MTDKRFVDIEVGADTGLIRLYTSDENYDEYNGIEVLKMLNELHDENKQLKLLCEINKPLFSHRELERINQRLQNRLDELAELNAMAQSKINDLEKQLYEGLE